MKNLFLFTGQETYLLQKQINEWKDAFDKKHGDINLAIIDGQEVPLNEVMAAVEAVPFLGEKRLIFIHGLPEVSKSKASDKITKKDEKRELELKKLESYLDKIPESSVVVFVQSLSDKRRSFYRKLVSMAQVKEFLPLQGRELISWIQKEVKDKGGSIDFPTAEYLISLVGQDLWRLSQDISKLTSYALSQSISRELIDSLVIPTLEANVFHFTDALGLKDHRVAIRKLHNTINAGENLRLLFYMIVRQFRLLLQANGYSSANQSVNPTAFAATFKLHPFVARNTLDQLKRFKRCELEDAYGSLLDIDTALKTSRIRITVDNQDELALAIERFILGFCCE